MALNPSFPAPTGVPLSTTDTREDLAGLVIRDAAGNVRSGVLPRHANALVTARASMGVDVAAFEAVLSRSGALLIANDGTVTVALGAAPSSNSRIDVVYVKQNESASPFSDANNTPTLGVAAGTAAASPTAPAAPTGAVPLAQVLIPSTATTTQSANVVITQVFPYTTLTGGVLWFRNATEQAAFTPAEGAVAYRLDTKWLGQYIGTAWQPVGGALPYANASLAADSAGAASTAWASVAWPASTLNDWDWASGTPTRFVAKTRGRISVKGSLGIGSTSFGHVRVLKNSAQVGPTFSSPHEAGLAWTLYDVGVDVVPGDFIEVQAQSNLTAALYGGSFVNIEYLRPRP